MPEVAELHIKVVSDKVDDATRRLDRLERQSRRTGKSNDALGRSFDRLKVQVVGLAGTYLGARGLISATSRYTRAVLSAERANVRIRNSLMFVSESAQGASDEFDYIVSQARKYGQSVETLATQYTKFAAAAKGTALQGEESRLVLEGIAAASATLALDSQQVEGAMRALEQIMSKGNVQAEELRGQLGERIPGAFQIAARSMGVTTQQLNRMLERGEVASEVFLPRFSRELIRTFGADMVNKTDNLTSAINRLNTELFLVFTDEKNQMGKSFQRLIEQITETIKDPAFQSAIAKMNEAFATMFQLGAEALKDVMNPSRLFDKASFMSQMSVLKTELEQAQGITDTLEVSMRMAGLMEKYSDTLAPDRPGRPPRGPIDAGTVVVPSTPAASGPDMKAFEAEQARRSGLRRRALSFFEDPRGRLMQLEDSYRTEREFLKTHREEVFRTEEEFQERLFALQMQYEDRKSSLQKEIADSEIQGLTGRLGAARDYFSELGILAQGESEKLFKVNKAFALADAVMKGFQAIQNAWASAVFPANLPAVALTTAKQAVNVASIQSQQFAGNYAYGGFLGGPYSSGDRMTFNGNRGEAILDPAQQRNFMALANGTAAGRAQPSITIIHETKAGETPSATTTTDADGNLIVRLKSEIKAELAEDVARGGTPMARAIEGPAARRMGIGRR